MTIPKFLEDIPTKVVAVGLNYKKHAEEMNMKIPDVPVIFMKPISSIISDGEDIIYPKNATRVDHEAELAILIGKKCKDVSVDEALDYVKGYTCLNDITERDIQKKDGQWTRAKSFDTFCPIGPRLVKDIDPNNVKIKCRLNGKIVQDSNTSDFIFNVSEIISFISGIMTLEKGDIITTGTPPGISPMKKGDMVEVEIEGIGILKNNIR